MKSYFFGNLNLRCCVIEKYSIAYILRMHFGDVIFIGYNV